jgi:hypothetical protein
VASSLVGMRRRLVSLTVLVLLGAAACSGQDDVEGQDGDEDVQTAAPATDLTDAVAIAQSSMPLALPDSRVGILLEDLCADADVTGQVQGLGLADQGQVDAAVAALEAGTDELCPGTVDPAGLDGLAAAAAPAPTTATADAGTAAAATGGTGGGASTGSSSRSGGTGGSTAAAGTGSSGSSTAGSSSGGGAGNTSTGSASSGGGDASGTGNQSSTGFTQSVGGSGASNSATAGTP